MANVRQGQDERYVIEKEFNFDITYESTQEYLVLIVEIANWLSDGNQICPHFENVKYITRTEYSHFVINLISYAGTVSLLFGGEDVYLKAYQTNNQWWAFENYVSQMFKNMALGEGYMSLETKAGKLREYIIPSRHNLEIAVTSLVYSDPRNDGELRLIADALLLMTQVFSESIRFSGIARAVDTNFDSQHPKPMGMKATRLENCWGKLCERLPINDESYLFYLNHETDNPRIPIPLRKIAALTALIKR